jgi:hypothetical protein
MTAPLGFKQLLEKSCKQTLVNYFKEIDSLEEIIVGEIRLDGRVRRVASWTKEQFKQKESQLAKNLDSTKGIWVSLFLLGVSVYSSIISWNFSFWNVCIGISSIAYTANRVSIYRNILSQFGEQYILYVQKIMKDQYFSDKSIEKKENFAKLFEAIQKKKLGSISIQKPK